MTWLLAVPMQGMHTTMVASTDAARTGDPMAPVRAAADGLADLRENRTAYLLLLPSMLAFAALVVFPLDQHDCGAFTQHGRGWPDHQVRTPGQLPGPAQRPVHARHRPADFGLYLRHGGADGTLFLSHWR